MNRSVLMVAYHFPPVGESTGFLRTLSFARHLPENSWRPIVLTVDPRAYPVRRDENLAEVPPALEVHRAFARDVRRHFSFFGLYAQWMATPDRWNSWVLGALPKGLALIRRHRPGVIWATYPIATSVLIGLALKRLTRIPWVLDLRDPLLYPAWPTDPWQRRVHAALERRAVRLADRVVLTTPGAARLYRERYPQLPADRWQVIENGVDEEIFAAVRGSMSRDRPAAADIVLVHGGLMETPDRDPSAFFAAIAQLRNAGKLTRRLRVVLRACGQEPLYQAKIDQLKIGDIVQLAPRIAYRDSIEEVLCASGLLLFQGPDCNDQIPAKAYEYVAAGRPILGLIDHRGDTAALLRNCGIPYLAGMNAPEEIAMQLERFITDIDRGIARGVEPEVASRYTRRERASELAKLLNTLVPPRVD